MRPLPALTAALPLALSLGFVAGSCSRRAAAQSPARPPVPAGAATLPATAANTGANSTANSSADAGRDAGWQRVADGVSYRRALVLGELNAVQEWLVVRLDLARVRLSARAMPHEAVADAAAERELLVAVDGGFFDFDHHPSGLLVSEGRGLFPYRPRAGSGVLLVRDGRADVIESASAPTPAPDVALAVQCGPRLVERDGSAGIYRDDGQRWARTAACVRDGGRTLDLITTWDRDVPLRGPGLYAFSRALAGPSPVGDPGGCERALNLDGGPSTGVYVRHADGASHAAVGPVPWALVATAR